MAGKGSRRLPYTLPYSTRDWVYNQKPVLLLHCDGVDESTTFKDSGITGHTVTRQGTAQIDTAQSWRGGSSGLFDGDSDYLSIPNHGDWDIDGTNVTIDFRVKHTTLGGTEVYIGQGEDYENKWGLYGGEDLLSLVIVSGGTDIVNMGASDGIPDTNWHHVALCKVGDEYGTYLDGTQVNHVSDATTDTFTGSLYIGAQLKSGGGMISHVTGWMEEIRMVKGNPFGAAPVVGLTDTIKVPFKPYISWR